MTKKSLLWGIGLVAGAAALAFLGKKAIDALEEFDESIDIDYATLHSWVWN